MKNIVIDVEKTLGDLLYIGHDAVFEYKDKKRTDNVIGYAYNLASSVQGDSVRVKVLGDLREFKPFSKVQLVDVDVKIYATQSGNYSNVNYSVSAQDIVGV